MAVALLVWVEWIINPQLAPLYYPATVIRGGFFFAKTEKVICKYCMGFGKLIYCDQIPD
jgi:hypothetical protein